MTSRLCADGVARWGEVKGGQAAAAEDAGLWARIFVALITRWAVLRVPPGKRLVPTLPILVPVLRREGDLDLSDEEAALLMRMSATTIDRRLADQRPD